MAPPAASSGVGFYVNFKSCTFTVGGYRWAIYLFPNGDRLDSADFISVFLALDEHVKGPMRVHLEFSFMDKVDKQDPTHVRTRQTVELHHGYAVGYRRFISREAMENLKHIKGDRFTIRCDLVVPENLDTSGNRKCESCNLRVATLGGVRLHHACFCDVCNHASRNDAAAKQCAGCHGPYDGFFLSFLNISNIN
uniref:Uncharacterized protein n=1 Tax=Aegilops tauschii TaxID=37682 RepID=N1QYK7_AEGTA